MDALYISDDEQAQLLDGCDETVEKEAALEIRVEQDHTRTGTVAGGDGDGNRIHVRQSDRNMLPSASQVQFWSRLEKAIHKNEQS